MIQFIIEISILVFLGGVLFTSLTLLKRFNALKQQNGELRKTVKEFNMSIAKAESLLNLLNQSSKDSSRQLEDILNKSDLQKDELTFLLNRSHQLAEKLEQHIRDGRSFEGQIKDIKVTNEPKISKNRSNQENISTEPKSEVERELFNVLKAAEA